MDQRSLENIEIELSILLKNLTLISTYKKFGNLDRSAYLLLYSIISCESTGVKSLAEELHLDISTISRQVRVLEEKGYLYRIPDKLDRRSYFLQATDLGLIEFNECKQLKLTKLEELLKNWSTEEYQVFGALLKKYNSSLADILK
ncbi:MarR family transcriptional regulator [Clostridiaceae bacterium UIB06]|uniref:MarR family transcriptional regulator n=1 Tax=Clostridium thailandense TaxID=2794346 RepID=A0A949TL28_9CLOT|nr:MarR family transcriptional regulator [Clostridium thailandense]MBV7274290.1 MarR family transcriptional regulator [Clostridium thailandense]MCH5136190.1 MarR family transcriptional regulator [Clostridiaceae bacterium UIB06]